MFFGLVAADGGSAFDPDDKGAAAYVARFDPLAPEAQAWLLSVCASARAAPWFARAGAAGAPALSDSASAARGATCAVDAARARAAAPCASVARADAPGLDAPLCCGLDGASAAAWPLERAFFARCLLEVSADAALDGVDAGVYFDAAPGADASSVRVLKLSFASDRAFSNDFREAAAWERAARAWAAAALGAPPAGLGLEGWWASDLAYFSVQEGLVAGALGSALLSTGVAAGALVLMTLNWIVALLAAGVVAAVVATEVGVLVAAGWRLGIIESIILSVAVGMSVDFVSHLAHGYVFAAHAGGSADADGARDGAARGRCGGDDGAARGEERRARAAAALAAHGGAITAAALSTAAAGAVMTLSVTIFYFKFGARSRRGRRG